MSVPCTYVRACTWVFGSARARDIVQRAAIAAHSKARGRTQPGSAYQRSNPHQHAARAGRVATDVASSSFFLGAGLRGTPTFLALAMVLCQSCVIQNPRGRGVQAPALFAALYDRISNVASDFLGLSKFLAGVIVPMVSEIQI
jgi:hypothetical protein